MQAGDGENVATSEPWCVVCPDCDITWELDGQEAQGPTYVCAGCMRELAVAEGFRRRPAVEPSAPESVARQPQPPSSDPAAASAEAPPEPPSPDTVGVFISGGYAGHSLQLGADGYRLETGHRMDLKVVRYQDLDGAIRWTDPEEPARSVRLANPSCHCGAKPDRPPRAR